MRKNVFGAVVLAFLTLVTTITLTACAHKWYRYEVDRPGLHVRTNDHRNLEHGTMDPTSDYVPPSVAKALEQNPKAKIKVTPTEVIFDGSPEIGPKILTGVCDNYYQRPIRVTIYVRGTNTMANSFVVMANSYTEFSMEAGDYRFVAVFADAASDPTVKEIRLFGDKKRYLSRISGKNYDFGMPYCETCN